MLQEDNILASLVQEYQMFKNQHEIKSRELMNYLITKQSEFKMKIVELEN